MTTVDVVEANVEVGPNEIIGILNKVQKELDAADQTKRDIGRRRDDLFDIALNLYHIHPMTLTKLLGLNPGVVYQAKKRIDKRKNNGRNSEASELINS